MQHRKRPSRKPPPLDEDLILAWADAYNSRTGKWPNQTSGHIPESVAYWREWRPGLLADVRGDTWGAINMALVHGLRGLNPGSSLMILLEDRRGIFNPTNLPTLTVEIILQWADAHFQRTGKWPNQGSGHILESVSYWRESRPKWRDDVLRGETWAAVKCALNKGSRGLPPGSSLATLLEDRRGVFNAGNPPKLTEELILQWADAHFQRTGAWPKNNVGHIPESVAYWHESLPGLSHNVRGDTWMNVNMALIHGLRSLASGSTLAGLLEKRRGVASGNWAPELTEDLILDWADAHFMRTGAWPSEAFGHIPESSVFWRESRPGLSHNVRCDTWGSVANALRGGYRGLKPGSSLPLLLEARRGVASAAYLPKLTIDVILRWANAHFERTSAWPKTDSGHIPESTAYWRECRPALGSTGEGDTWSTVNRALVNGFRGLSPGPSLATLLEYRRGASNHKNRPKLTEELIVEWANAHFDRTECWPKLNSGVIPESLEYWRACRPHLGDKVRGDTWQSVSDALTGGIRGLPSGRTLLQLLEERCGVLNYKNRPDLNDDLIVQWANAHFERTGSWPHRTSGQIPESVEHWRSARPALRENQLGDTWQTIDSAMRRGRRGLQPGGSLTVLLEQRLGVYNPNRRPQLTVDLILQWADAYHERHGAWPDRTSGLIPESEALWASKISVEAFRKGFETWSTVNFALKMGTRGLSTKSSLSKLIKERRQTDSGGLSSFR